jgi:hypothetical protein
MAIDLWFGKTRRSWSRTSQLTSDPLRTAAPVADLPDPSRTIKKAFSQALAPGIRVKKHGQGAVVSKKWKWG